MYKKILYIIIFLDVILSYIFIKIIGVPELNPIMNDLFDKTTIEIGLLIKVFANALCIEFIEFALDVSESNWNKEKIFGLISVLYVIGFFII